MCVYSMRRMKRQAGRGCPERAVMGLLWACCLPGVCLPNGARRSYDHNGIYKLHAVPQQAAWTYI